MKAVGVIVEYNPFHNGHAYHVQSAKEASGADVVVAVMSGNFLQRGEPALVSKWYRTKMALLNGVDVVIELPYQFAVQKAETFANGAVSILDAVGCHSLCFGSESGDILSFKKTIKFIERNQQQLDDNIQKNIKTGVSYPKALSLSYQEMSSGEEFVNLAKPNNILGYHYIKSLLEQNSHIEPLTVQRKNADYHDEHFATETIASATSIRKALFSNNEDHPSIEQYVPETTYQLLKDYQFDFGGFHRWENYWPLLQFRLIQSSPNELREIYEVEEGLEHRLKGAAITSISFQDFMQQVKTKRYTWTRLQRICVHILTNSKKDEMKTGLEKASYLRLLGMTQKGKEYLNKQKSHVSLPLVSKLSAFKQPVIMHDIKASQIYSLGLGSASAARLSQLEYKQPPIYIK
nr:nucleotidyltransferase [Neobacillus sp. Marseille-Q6967]